MPLSLRLFEQHPGAAGGVHPAWLHVHGFQHGRYVSNIGPQAANPIPEGISVPEERTRLGLLSGYLKVVVQGAWICSQGWHAGTY